MNNFMSINFISTWYREIFWNVKFLKFIREEIGYLNSFAFIEKIKFVI